MNTTRTSWLLFVARCLSAGVLGLAACSGTKTTKTDASGSTMPDGAHPSSDTTIADTPIGSGGSGGTMVYDGPAGQSDSGGATLGGNAGAGSGGAGGIDGSTSKRDSAMGGTGGTTQLLGSGGRGGSIGSGGAVRTGGAPGTGGSRGRGGTSGIPDAPVAGSRDGGDAPTLILGVIELCPVSVDGPAGSSCEESTTSYCKPLFAEDTCWCNSSKIWECPTPVCPAIPPGAGAPCTTPSRLSGQACLYNNLILYCEDRKEYSWGTLYAIYPYTRDGGAIPTIDASPDNESPPPFVGDVEECSYFEAAPGESCSPRADFVGILACASGSSLCVCAQGHWLCPSSSICPNMTVSYYSGATCEKEGSMCQNSDGQFCMCIYDALGDRLMFSCFSSGTPIAVPTSS